MASIDEVLGGLGSAKLTHDYDPDVADAAVFGRTLRIWQGEELVWGGPLLTRTVSKDGIDLQARNHEFWMGLDEDGPVVEDKEFVAGTNKLSNPGFELGDLYWRTGENSKWTVEAANAETGSYSARVTANPTSDDVLQSDESFEAEAGQEFRLAVKAKRLTGTVGQLRPQLIFEGKFQPTNIFDPIWVDGSWVDASIYAGGTAGDSSFSGGVATIGPVTQPQLITNPTLTATNPNPPSSPWVAWASTGGAWNSFPGVYQQDSPPRPVTVLRTRPSRCTTCTKALG